jgi:hypothetical protein
MLACATLAAATSVGAASPVDSPVDQGFLSVPLDDMREVERDRGVDLVYIAPGAFESLGDYDAVMIDQPEVWIDRGSDYPGTKPDYLKAVVDLIRDKLTGALIRGGHDVVEAPGPNVAFMRVALTDLYLKKKPGMGARGYSAVRSQSPDQMLRSMLEYFDVVEMALQLEVVDLDSEAVLGAIVIRRGERGTRADPRFDQRLDFAEFLGIVDEYAGRVRCRFDNGRRPVEEWIDCAGLTPQAATQLALERF